MGSSTSLWFSRLRSRPATVSGHTHPPHLSLARSNPPTPSAVARARARAWAALSYFSQPVPWSLSPSASHSAHAAGECPARSSASQSELVEPCRAPRPSRGD
eukprot:scaffold303202_cov32-Tisochrysis_lutea.AAC.2